MTNNNINSLFSFYSDILPGIIQLVCRPSVDIVALTDSIKTQPEDWNWYSYRVSHKETGVKISNCQNWFFGRWRMKIGSCHYDIQPRLRDKWYIRSKLTPIFKRQKRQAARNDRRQSRSVGHPKYDSIRPDLTKSLKPLPKDITNS